ncbi:MAG: nicotinate-nucleotide adenylyltransferase [Armatimonadetes bacterium]|nr:nicotinate-nucleotide adenylyltransferase [Armatimonadota bacterium]
MQETYPECLRRVGLMGGTFDPVHYGHLLAAEEARDRYSLDLIVFVPNGVPPHKKGYPISDAEHRYNMCVLATASNPWFIVSREEIDRPGPSYSIDTIRAFRRQIGPDVQLFFITGADAVLQLLTWRCPDAIIQESQVVAVHRPGFDLRRLAEALGEERARRIIPLEAPGVEISSTDIRQRVAQGRSIRYLVPESVEAYIRKMRLYVSPLEACSLAQGETGDGKQA